MNGKLVFYQDGLIFVDKKAAAFALDYNQIDQINFFLEDTVWMQVIAKESATGLPYTLLAEKVLYLKITNDIYEQKFKAFTGDESYIAEKYPELKVKKIYEKCPFVHDSQSYNNFVANMERYHREFSCDFYNTKFQADETNMILEFQTISEFNEIRSKEFIPYLQFKEIHQEQ